MQTTITYICSFSGVGGGLLPADVKSTDPGAEDKIVGSFIVVKAESIDVVWDTIKKDIFYTSGEVVRGDISWLPRRRERED